MIADTSASTRLIPLPWLVDCPRPLGRKQIVTGILRSPRPSSAASLVIPNFGLGPVGFEETYLTEIQPDGRWMEVSIDSRLVLI